MAREKLGSRLGFILLSAGCAIGIGNVWKFPYMVGKYGGAIFVLIYLIFLLILGVPVMTMEFSLGRASQKSPARLYQELEPKGSKWHIHGYVALLGNYVLMMFYTTVAGWMMNYFVSTATGRFEGLDTSGVNHVFEEINASPSELIFYTFLAIFIGILICSLGVRKGVERITKYMMLALLAIMLVLAVNSCFLEGGEEGIRFYLVPDWNKVKEVGLGNVIYGAMTQAFFTLSLGIGSMAIFGSYIGKDRALLGEAVHVAALDTFVALSSGLIIFPACFSYNVEVTSGPPLIFQTLPNIFNNMPLGRLWGSLFFVFMCFAAMSTVIAVFEMVISCTMEMFSWTRKKACLINLVILLVTSLPCILGFNLLSGFHPLGGNSNILDLEDFIVSTVLLPGGSFVYILFCVTRYGWGFKNFMEEANIGKGLKVKKWMRGYMTFVLPVILMVVLIYGVVKTFI